MLVSCPHTNAERMSLSDRAASLLAAGVNAAYEGAGCLKRLLVVVEGAVSRRQWVGPGKGCKGWPEGYPQAHLHGNSLVGDREE